MLDWRVVLSGPPMMKAYLPGFFSRYSKRSMVAVSKTDPAPSAVYSSSNQSTVAPLVGAGATDATDGAAAVAGAVVASGAETAAPAPRTSAGRRASRFRRTDFCVLMCDSLGLSNGCEFVSSGWPGDRLTGPPTCLCWSCSGGHRTT